MDYICLAAGKGTRFGELGRYLQKCMYPVGLEPFVALSVKNLLRSANSNQTRDNDSHSEHAPSSPDRLSFVIGYHGEQVQRYFGDSYLGLPVQYIRQEQQLGTAHAIYTAYQALQPQSSVIIWLADLYVPAALFQQLLEHPAPNVQTVAPAAPGEKDDLRVSIAGDSIRQTWRGDSALYDIGLWKLTPEVLAQTMARRDGEYRILPNLQQALEQGHRFGYVQAGEWLHLGGVNPSPEANVQQVLRRIAQLEATSA